MRMSILFFVALAILQSINCTSNNKPGKSNNIIEDDSIYTEVDTINYLFDTGDIDEVNLSTKDENDVWFENTSIDQLRIVYQYNNKILLVYLNQKALKTYNNITGIDLTLNKEQKFLSFSNSKDDIIVKIIHNKNMFPNSSIEYNFSKNKVYKGSYHYLKKIIPAF